jgi:hypothetical protein
MTVQRIVFSKVTFNVLKSPFFVGDFIQNPVQQR